MPSIHERFSGLFIPHVTPFDDSGAVDLESLTRLTKHFCSLAGVAGLVSCARIGESPVLSSAEKAANDRIMVCCSGCKTPKLVLDL